jgi:lipopolysaccharide export system permease protein
VKILDKYLLKTFLITFATVFVILFFIFVLQVVWLFISELAGKDLDLIMIGKFLLFKMPSVVPLVLPLSVLLASIMTFGSLAENYEFAAMKSSGISLQRAMRSLTYFILCLSFVAFLFANNVIPYAEYKFVNFRRNIAQVKPAMAIAEGQFSEIGNYNIKVEKKSGTNGKYLDLVTIHKKSDLGDGSKTVIKAKKGELVSNEDSNVLKLVLKDGNYYEDITPQKYEDRIKRPFAKSEFKRYVLNIDLSKLNNANLDEGQITNTNTMLTVSELKYTLDSLQKNYTKDVLSYSENLYQRSLNSGSNIQNTGSTVALDKQNILKNYKPEEKIQILRVGGSYIDAIAFSLQNSKFELDEREKNINEHWIALYDKFVIAFSCILMFFIGAPLGAIIRKGGLGLPIVFAILIFITFHFINTFGKKVAQENGIPAFLGCWLSTLVLLPLAIVLTKRATADKGVNLNLDWLTHLVNKIFPNKEEALVTPLVIDGLHNNGISLEGTSLEENTTIENTVASQHPIDYDKIAALRKSYKPYSFMALGSYFALLAVVALNVLDGTAFIITTAILVILFIGSAWKSQKLINTINSTCHKTNELAIISVLLGGFPFYILFYLYNSSHLKEITSNTNV